MRARVSLPLAALAVGLALASAAGGQAGGSQTIGLTVLPRTDATLLDPLVSLVVPASGCAAAPVRVAVRSNVAYNLRLRAAFPQLAGAAAGRVAVQIRSSVAAVPIEGSGVVPAPRVEMPEPRVEWSAGGAFAPLGPVYVTVLPSDQPKTGDAGAVHAVAYRACAGPGQIPGVYDVFVEVLAAQGR